MAQTSQLDDIRGLTGLAYDQLQHALELIPDDQTSHKAASSATTPAHIAIHTCAADLNYSNVIDGGSRRVPLREEDEPSKDALLRLVADARQTVDDLLDGLDDAALDGERQVRWWKEPASVRWILIHMIRHKYYHTGQLNYIHFLLGIEEP